MIAKKRKRCEFQEAEEGEEEEEEAKVRLKLAAGDMGDDDARFVWETAASQ